MLQKIWNFFQNLFKKKETSRPLRHEPVYGFKILEGKFPEMLETRTLYVLTEDGNPWEAAMICPCGCGSRLELNLLPDERPRWQYSVNKKGLPTLHPSVNREIGCRSHFFLRQGKIVWAGEYFDRA